MFCKKNAGCSLFQYNKASGNCELKSGTAVGSSVNDTDMITGPAVCDYLKCNC